MISSIPYNADTIFTKVLPSLFFSSKSSGKWTKSWSSPKLHDVKSIQLRKLWAPYELFKTEMILTGRNATYLGNINHAFSDSVKNKAIEIRKLLSEATEGSTALDANETALDTIEANATTLMNQEWETPSMRRFANHPHSRTAFCLSWGLRLSALYYFSPFESRTIAATFAALATIPYSMLLVPGARRKLANLRAPKIQEKFSLSEKCQKEIYKKGKRFFGKNEGLKDLLSKITLEATLKDPFLNADYYWHLAQKARKAKHKERLNSKNWYELGWEEQTALISYYDLKNKSDEKEAAEKERRVLWDEWYQQRPKEATSFWKHQKDVKESIPEDKKEDLKILDRKGKNS